MKRKQDEVEAEQGMTSVEAMMWKQASQWKQWHIMAAVSIVTQIAR